MKNITNRILLVEDEPGLLLALEDRLKIEGHLIETADNGIRAEEKIRKGSYDLIVLDIMLPGRDGLQICQNLRNDDIQTPILMLTARGSNIDTVMGLRIGADDYLIKPFDMQVLVARIDALLRRSEMPKKTKTSEGRRYAIGEFIFDTGLQELSRESEIISLNAQEYRLLKYLVEHPDRVHNRNDLLNEVWGYDTDTTTRTVDVHVAWLRQKLEEQDRPSHIITVRGYGYKFVAEKD